MKPLVLLLALTAAFPIFALRAEPEPTGNDKPDTRQITPPAPLVVSTPLRTDEHISVDFPDNPIPEVLSDVAARFGYTVAISESFRGRTSIKLRDVSWVEVFREVLTPVGYDFYPDGKTIRVISPNDPPTPLVKREFHCIFGSPVEFAEVATGQIGKGRSEIHGQTVTFWADWRYALDLDWIFRIWDRPRKVYPEAVYFPSPLPFRFTPPDAGPQTPPSGYPNGRFPDRPSCTMELGFDHVDARRAAKLIQSILTEKGERIQTGICPNSLRITFTITSWKQGMIEDLRRYLDDRKWYLTPEEREHVDAFAAYDNGTQQHVFTPAEIAAQIAASPPVAISDKPDLISVDFTNEERSTILRSVAKCFSRTVEFPPNFQGRTSIKLRNVTCWQIFQEVLTPIGCGFYPDGTAIHVISRDSPPPPLVYREYTCVFRTADEFVDSFARQFANADHERYEVSGRTLKVWISWHRAEKLDSIFKSWDQPLLRFPATIRWPDSLPSALLESATGAGTDRPGGMPRIGSLSESSTTEIHILNWVSARAVAARIRPLLADPLDQLQVDDSGNALIITTDSRQHEVVQRVCRFLDDRKWYLDPTERITPAAQP